MSAAVPARIEVDGRRLALSNLDKPLWPLAAFTKGQMLDYYARVAPALVPQLAGRPLTLRRFPDGVDEGGWYQNQCRGTPEWLRTARLAGREGKSWRFCVIDDVSSLLYVANLASLELHPFLHLAAAPEVPTAVVFDLDPGPPADVVACCEVALRLRELLERVGLEGYPKTSGSVGLHVYVPLNTPHPYAETKRFARALAALLAEERPDAVVDRQARSLRAGKVLVDWLQNDPTRSTVAPYSLRAAGWPTVSTPVEWDEVERCAAERRPDVLTFEASDLPGRLERLGDLFRPVLELEQAVPG